MDIKSKAVLAVVMAVMASGSAQADGWHNHYRHDFPRHRPVHVRGADWIAPLVVLGIAGAAISAAASAPVVIPARPAGYQEAPVYSVPAGPVYTVVPQTLVQLPAGVAYYCPSYGQFHPQVQSCPVGWQLVDVAR